MPKKIAEFAKISSLEVFEVGWLSPYYCLIVSGKNFLGYSKFQLFEMVSISPRGAKLMQNYPQFIQSHLIEISLTENEVFSRRIQFIFPENPVLKQFLQNICSLRPAIRQYLNLLVKIKLQRGLVW